MCVQVVADGGGVALPVRVDADAGRARGRLPRGAAQQRGHLHALQRARGLRRAERRPNPQSPDPARVRAPLFAPEAHRSPLFGAGASEEDLAGGTVDFRRRIEPRAEPSALDALDEGAASARQAIRAAAAARASVDEPGAAIDDELDEVDEAAALRQETVEYHRNIGRPAPAEVAARRAALQGGDFAGGPRDSTPRLCRRPAP